MRIRILRVLAGIGLLLVCLSASSNFEGEVTYGDVSAWFNAPNSLGALAFGPAGGVPQVINSAPINGVARGRINPIRDGSVQTACENDWHVVNLIVFDPVDAVTLEEFTELTNALEMVSTVDGDLQAMMETSIKVVPVDPSGERSWAKNWGYFIEPGALAVGLHEITWLIFVDGVLVVALLPTVDVLPADDPACS